MKVYVGDYSARPSGVDELPDEYRLLHPAQFHKIVEYGKDFWTNNPHVVSEFLAQDVIVCVANNGLVVCRELTSHPTWETWKNEFDAGEFWSCIDDRWPFTE